MKQLIICVFLFLKASPLFSQSILSSNIYIQTCVQKTQCFSINNSGYLFYDESKNSFYLKLDFNTFKTGQDTLDDWLDDLSSTLLYLKLPLEKEKFEGGFSNHNTKVFKINGQLFLNGIWEDQNIQLTLFTSENGVLNTTNNANAYDNFKVSFNISFAPKDFKIHKKPHHLKKTVFIGISSGRINLLKPGMQKLLGEAYDHN